MARAQDKAEKVFGLDGSHFRMWTLRIFFRGAGERLFSFRGGLAGW